MGEGTIFDRLEAMGRRSADRQARRAAILRGAQTPVLVGLTMVTATAWWLSGWDWWPWTGGFAAVLLLALLGAPRRIGPVYTLAVALAVVDVWFLLLVDPWWWVVLAGVVLAGAGAAAAIRLRFRTRRRETAGTLALGFALLATGVTMLLVDAAAAREQAQHELNQAHEQAVARLLPRTPGSMVAALVEGIGQANDPREVSRVCFIFSPRAQRQLAAAHGAPDCAGAIRALGAQVTDRLDYINNLWLPGAATTRGPSPDVQVVDACHLDFSAILDDTPTATPGPQIGVLTLQQQDGEGSLIVDYRACGAGS